MDQVWIARVGVETQASLGLMNGSLQIRLRLNERGSILRLRSLEEGLVVEGEVAVSHARSTDGGAAVVIGEGVEDGAHGRSVGNSRRWLLA